MTDKIWVVATILENTWMCEGLYWTEKEAVAAAKPGQAIILTTVGTPFPKRAVDAEKLYFPNEETWKESKLFKIRSEADRQKRKDVYDSMRKMVEEYNDTHATVYDHNRGCVVTILKSSQAYQNLIKNEKR
jgi:hypothetical protein